MATDQNYLRTGTAIGFRASHELFSDYLLEFQIMCRGPQMTSAGREFETPDLNGIVLSVKPISELQSITCHMGSHSFTCNLTQVNVPRLNPSQTAYSKFTTL